MLKRVLLVLISMLLALSSGLLFAQAEEHPLEDGTWTVPPGIPIQVIEKANGEVFLHREMTDVVEHFLDSDSEDVGRETPSWLDYLERPHPSVATMRMYFQEAERRYGVPADLLMAIGQVESNWTQYGPTIDQGWGVMHLVQNNYADTLGRAAELLGVTEETLKDDARLNIFGAAAVMVDAAGSSAQSFTRVGEWFEAAMVLSALIDEPLRHKQAVTYYERLRTGVRASTLWGEQVELEPHPEVDFQSEADRTRPESLRISFKSADYPPALTDFTTCAYDSRYGTTIDTWVNHWIGTAGGTYAGTISWFKNCSREFLTSAHFVIRASDGEITQVVRVADNAWHAGSGSYNRRSIGVEHEVTVSNPDNWYNMTLITASTDMARYFANIYPITRGHRDPGIMGHKEIVATTCPGNTMPWGVWMNKLNGGPGGCFCDGGISYWGESVPKGDAYCDMQVCGGWTPDHSGPSKLFRCTSSGWSFTGTYNCDCKCTGGYNSYGDPILPDYTYCGMRVCGTDDQYWDCYGSGGSGGWQATGISCSASPGISVLNSGIENNSSGQYGDIDYWDPSGAWAYHSQYPAGNNQSLGAKFGYYSAGTSEMVGQVLSTRFSANTTYTFKSWAIGGGNRTGQLPYQIGYALVDGDLNSFVLLNTQVVNLTGNQSWVETAGVTYTTGSSGGELNRQIIVRFGSGSAGGSSDIWFDNITVASQ